MPRGFFHGSVIAQSKQPGSRLPQCGACGLYKTCNSPKMSVTGAGELETLVVAEAPGKDEDDNNEQLVGDAGQVLRKTLRKIDVDLDRDCWKTNAIICRPPKNRTPTEDEIDYCRPNLLNTIEQLNPKRIILLGGAAVQSLIRHLWGRKPEKVSRWVGWKIPCQQLNAWVCPSFHPSYVMREKNSVLNLWFKRHLEEAFKSRGRPFEVVPDYRTKVERIYETSAAAIIIREMASFSGAASFDYEANRLKPEPEDSQIVCASIAWGYLDKADPVERCVSFPFAGEAKEALKEFLYSPIPKIAANLKMEDRWTRHIFGKRVRNWKFDTMQAAHVLDHRPGVTSLKFQAFVRLGQPEYDRHLAGFLEEEGGDSTVNQILREISIEDLLLYNGLDSVMTQNVAVKQMEELSMGGKSC